VRDDDDSGCLLDERLQIETPERVTIVYDVAGIGSRFAAGAIDVLILAFVFFVLGVVFAIAASVAFPKTDEAKMTFAMAVAGAFTSLLSLYYVGFEWFWDGQTPGKRVFDLRVVSDGGGPASIGAVFVRNILRVADLLPGFAPYGLGGFVMFVNRRSKRIGDYAAGTMVVRERAQPILPAAAPRADASSGDALAAADVERIRAFVSRAPQMIAASRAALARRIAEDVASRHGISFDDPEQFLRLLASGRTPRELRDAQGPAQ
jgi:uncharacterized RDD family membrane protein YckC